MIAEVPREQLASCLDEVAADIVSQGGTQLPPVNPLRIATELGLVVAVDASQQSRGRIVRLRDSPGSSGSETIFLRPESRPERLQWSVAHELGERAAHLVFLRLGLHETDVPAGARERVANWLAARILLPSDWFVSDGRRCEWDLTTLKRRYETASHELIARRMLDFEAPILVTIVDQGRLTFRRSNVPGRVPGLLPVEQEACRRARQNLTETRVCRETLRVRVWPIHEPGWCREIIRTDLESGISDTPLPTAGTEE